MQQRVEIFGALLWADTPIHGSSYAAGSLFRSCNDLVKQKPFAVITLTSLKRLVSSADECTIIRRGKYMSTVDVSKTSETELATLR